MKINWKQVASLSLTGTLIFASSCGVFGGKSKKRPGANEAAPSTDELDNAGGDTADAEVMKDEITADAAVLNVSSVKVRNFQQYYATYGLLLGIPSDNADFIAAFAAVATSLPTTSSVKGFLGSHQLAAMKLASAGCNIAYDTASLEERRSKFGIDFTGGQPIAVFSTDNRIAFAKNLLGKFWAMDTSSLPDTDPDVMEISKLIEDSLTNLSKDTPAITNEALIKAGTVAACSAVLSGLPVSFY